MATKIKDIVVPSEYESNGEKKTAWNRVGKYVSFTRADGSGGEFIELYMFPNLKFKIFDQKPKTDRGNGYSAPNANNANTGGYVAPTGQNNANSANSEAEPDTIEYPEETINAEDIPF